MFRGRDDSSDPRLDRTRLLTRSRCSLLAGYSCLRCFLARAGRMENHVVAIGREKGKLLGNVLSFDLGNLIERRTGADVCHELPREQRNLNSTSVTRGCSFQFLYQGSSRNPLPQRLKAEEIGDIGEGDCSAADFVRVQNAYAL